MIDRRWGMVLGCAALFAFGMRAPGAEPLARLDPESVEDIGSRITRDAAHRTAGEASIRVRSRWPTVVNVGEAPGPGRSGGRLIYRADLRSQDLQGTAYLELWVHLPEGGMYFSRGLEDVVRGTTDWRELRTVFHLDPNAQIERVTLNLVINGHGTVWIDNARLDHQSE